MTIKWYHILALVVAILLGWYLGSSDPEVVVETKYDTRIDTVTIESIVHDTDTLILPPRPIDTNAVVEAFYRKKTFDTTVVSNEVKIKFTGSLYENQLRNVVFETQNLRPTQIVREMTWSFWGGFVVGTNIVAPSISVQRDNHQFGLSYNLVGDEQRFLMSYKYRLWHN